MSEEEKKSLFWRVYCHSDAHGDNKWKSRWTPDKFRAENAAKTHKRATGHEPEIEESEDPFNRRGRK